MVPFRTIGTFHIAVTRNDIGSCNNNCNNNCLNNTLLLFDAPIFLRFRILNGRQSLADASASSRASDACEGIPLLFRRSLPGYLPLSRRRIAKRSARHPFIPARFSPSFAARNRRSALNTLCVLRCAAKICRGRFSDRPRAG